MQLKIYISATFTDLEPYRDKVYRALRSLRHDVIAMEDYVAADKRPLDKCLQDVASCDVYVGIFAWRYGYVPKADNPRKKSITELELREAERLKKPRLIFVLKDDAPWPPTMTDMATGENQKGKQIKALRQELKENQLASIFETADELAAKVVSAVYRWQIESSVVPSVTTEPAPDPGGPAQARSDYKRLWVPGSRVRVRFLAGTPIIRRRILRFAQIWSAYANINFEVSADKDAEVRISFDASIGSWSYLGTDCLAVSASEATMNFDRLAEETPMDALEGSVLGAFGRVLGLYDEHKNPDAAIPWNKQMVYEVLGAPPNSWSKETIDQQFFSVWDRRAFPFAKPFDPQSIMTKPIPPEFTMDGLSIGRYVALSAGDKEFISWLYPYVDAEKPEAKPRKRSRKPR